MARYVRMVDGLDGNNEWTKAASECILSVISVSNGLKDDESSAKEGGKRKRKKKA